MTSNRHSDEFTAINANRDAKLRSDDFTLHQDAVAGRDNGYGGKHHSGNARGNSLAKRQHAEASTMLDLLLQDPVYAKLHQDTLDLLSRAERATDRALLKLEKKLTDLADLAARLPDGRAVLRDKTGDIWTTGGQQVAAKDTSGVIWPEDAPTREEYIQSQKTADELRSYQVEVLGEAREELSDPDNPPSEAELKGIQERIEELAPLSIKEEVMPASVPPAVDQQSALAIEIPSI